MVPVVHLDITGWSQLSTYVKNGMVPVVHGTSCLAPGNLYCEAAEHILLIQFVCWYFL